MDIRRTVFLVLIIAGFVISAQKAFSAPNPMEEIRAHLYAGDTANAVATAEAHLAEVPDDQNVLFALGATQFLQAIENLGRGLHRYGLWSQYNEPTGLSGLPFLRVPVPENQNPEPVSYEALRAVLAGFVRDLTRAEETLSGVADMNVVMPINIGLVRLDLDADGMATDEEALWRIFARVGGMPWLTELQARQLMVDFDASDVPWLRGYSHLLMAIAEFPLAHDWSRAYDATFHALFPLSPVSPSSPVLLERHAEWLEQLAYQPPDMHSGDFAGFAGIADLVVFVHLMNWPVVEPERMRHVLEHFEAMVALSRENWRRILAETDDGNEWIPNPSQRGALARVRVSQDRVAGWQRFLDEFEALLQGEKLLPHWRFDEGINIRRIFLEPRTFDPLLLIQGAGALPYLEEGEETTGETWEQIQALLGGDFLRYFIWFN